MLLREPLTVELNYFKVFVSCTKYERLHTLFCRPLSELEDLRK